MDTHTGSTAPSKGSKVRCPFYGFRWPEKSSELTPVGGNECGLDMESNGPCAMEAAGRHVNYFACPVAIERKTLLDAAERLISFGSGDGHLETLEEWKSSNGWRRP